MYVTTGLLCYFSAAGHGQGSRQDYKANIMKCSSRELNGYSNTAGNISKLTACWKLGAQKTKKKFHILCLIGLGYICLEVGGRM